MSSKEEKNEVERLKIENARLYAALEEAEYECQRLTILNSNLEMQLDESNRELEKNIEVLQSMRGEIDSIVASLKNS
jgi:predicted RNase H-like nuclease (RuvC/YqgF family)